MAFYTHTHTHTHTLVHTSNPCCPCRLVMAVAGQDAGVTLVSFRCSRASQPRTRDPPPKPPKPPRPPSSDTRRSRPSSGRRSLSRLLGRCAESEEEEEQQAAQQQQQQQTVNHRLSGVPAELPDSPELSVDKIKLVGFKRSHSFCVQPKKSKNISCRSSSSSRAGKENGGWSYESQTLKTSREVKMERERVRQARGETLWADKDDVFSSFIRQNQERFSTLLEERGFAHIPPPAGFGAPTRPSSLLATLSCGPTSLDEGSLSGAARRRTTYTIRRSATAGFTTTTNNKENESVESGGVADVEDSPLNSTVKEKEEEEEEEEPWCDLPSSPLSPPSPFHHPFFRHQLGLPTPVADPWARFSGFGMPRLPQVLLAHAQAQQEAAAARKEEWNRAREEEGSAEDDEEEEGEERVVRRQPASRAAGRNQYCVTSRHSVVRYCSSTNSYK